MKTYDKYQWVQCTRYSSTRWQICHRCQRRRWQIATGINDIGDKLATSVNVTELRISLQISKKIETALMVYSTAWGKLIHEKNQKSKISLHCPFNGYPYWKVEKKI